MAESGKIRRVKGGQGARAGLVLKPWIFKLYPAVSLYRDRQVRKLTVHEVVAAAFIGPRPSGFQINHKDGDKENPHAANLEYVTHGDNVRHAFATGLMKVGSQRSFAKLDEAKVRAIRSLQGTMPLRGIGEEFGVSQKTIADILARKSWKHVI